MDSWPIHRLSNLPCIQPSNPFVQCAIRMYEDLAFNQIIEKEYTNSLVPRGEY